MLWWFRKFSRRQPSRDELLNEGLDLAMNWGEDWLAPINRRLGERHPQLSEGELGELNGTCRHAMTFAFEAAHVLLHSSIAGPLEEAFGSAVNAEFPWVSQENLSRMLNQGLYYAAKMGGHGRDA